MTTDQQTRATVWPDQIYEVLKDAGVSQVAYVPDAGHAKLINRCHADKAMHAVSLNTEEEGIAMLAGAWMGGAKGVLLMQSSGVGNCINMLSLYEECRLPLLMIVTMRGVWANSIPGRWRWAAARLLRWRTPASLCIQWIARRISKRQSMPAPPSPSIPNGRSRC